jgi:hypothetical protein
VRFRDCCDPGRFESSTKNIVLKVASTILIIVDSGLTRVVMLGIIADFTDVVFLDRYKSVKIYWFTNSGTTLPSGDIFRNATPESIPSPSNQWASLPRSSWLTGLPPLRTYWPPVSSGGMRPLYVHGVRLVVF